MQICQKPAAVLRRGYKGAKGDAAPRVYVYGAAGATPRMVWPKSAQSVMAQVWVTNSQGLVAPHVQALGQLVGRAFAVGRLRRRS